MASKPAKTSKVWRASRTSSAGMFVTETSAALIGTEDNLVVADERGVTISGPISLITDAANLRRGGLFIGLNDFTDMIPSTIVTPIPKQIPFPPISGVVGLSKDVAFFASLLI